MPDTGAQQASAANVSLTSASDRGTLLFAPNILSQVAMNPTRTEESTSLRGTDLHAVLRAWVLALLVLPSETDAFPQKALRICKGLPLCRKCLPKGSARFAALHHAAGLCM